MPKKKKMNWFFKVLLGLFVIYISLTIAIETGYYEAKLNKKTVITQEGIKQFEQDVLDGVDVDIKDYISETNEDYSTRTSKMGLLVANTVEKFMTEGISKMIDVFKTLFT